jgi:tetratricopeptide (TPR) repeat protein
VNRTEKLIKSIFVFFARMLSIISEIHAARRRMLAGNASKALKSIAAYEVPFATLHIVRGECHYVLGDWNEAVREFETALRRSPNSPRAEIMLELASEMVELSNAIRPPASLEQLLGVQAESNDVPPLPKLSLTAAAHEEPMPVETTNDEIGLVSETLAELMIRQRKFDEARKVYIQLSRLNPDRYEYFRDKIKSIDERTSE